VKDAKASSGRGESHIKVFHIVQGGAINAVQRPSRESVQAASQPGREMVAEVFPRRFAAGIHAKGVAEQAFVMAQVGRQAKERVVARREAPHGVEVLPGQHARCRGPRPGRRRRGW
jgi:hypothetical protein